MLGAMGFPVTRQRRLRGTSGLRQLVRESDLKAQDFIYPLFVEAGLTGRKPIETMPGVDRLSIDLAVKEAGEAHALGVQSVLLYGVPDPSTKDEIGSVAWDDEGVVQLTVRALKSQYPELVVMCDVCLCSYTTHGHCGALCADRSVDNDTTLEHLAQIGLSYATAGADFVAPSDMMDGNVDALRTTLDENGFERTSILAYSAKYASSFYGSFRDACESRPQFGDRKGYQMDPANAREALREVELDIQEGADIVMVKPALAYLDVIYRVKETFKLPVAAYNVSGEYSMVKAGAAAGMIDEKAVTLELLTSMKRAGADIILSYHAKDVAGWLQ